MNKNIENLIEAYTGYIVTVINVYEVDSNSDKWAEQLKKRDENIEFYKKWFTEELEKQIT